MPFGKSKCKTFIKSLIVELLFLFHIRNEKKRRKEKSKGGDYQYQVSGPRLQVVEASGDCDGSNAGSLGCDDGSGTDTPPIVPSNNPTDPGGIEDDNIDTDVEDCDATWNSRECTNQKDQRERSINGECNNLRNR